MDSHASLIADLTQKSAPLGEIGLCIIEDGEDKHSESVIALAAKQGYGEAQDAGEAMEMLSAGSPVCYAESSEKLHPLVWDIVQNYEGGMVSQMDRKNATGLRTIHFHPQKSPLLLILTRQQVENSHPELIASCGPSISIPASSCL